ncbi:MAG: cytochrome c3 family protein [candidate division KSB1 bacterium]|nr:cytochrome c3 family protein [candidate division KSB1 bacterium]MDZ7365200.1 cytochrome c3 family protein [candidate division KSB1 bacterium]MDZ7406958.1 cytochrome c3 family protein [candidate division KSB1 bacterium]
MNSKEDNKKNKGAFSELKLSVSRRYIYSNPRPAMMVAGGLMCLGILGYYVIDFFFLKKSIVASGPLSSPHAKFERDCVSCHEPFKAATSAKCSACHEKTGDKLGVYTFAGHYVYRSGEMQRLKTAAANFATKETACAVCHQEHQGRNALIINVPDAYCTSCHVYGSFNNNHPQFQFVAKKFSDDSTLAFTHIKHVKEIVKREKLMDIERACLYCHNPQPDGRHFEPIAFERHCSACHLNGNVATPPLKMKTADALSEPGVETLEAIRRRRSPGVMWAFNTNPNEFQIKPGNRLVKSPVRHKDPWVLENLKTIQRMLYPNLGLAELLKTAGGTGGQNQPAAEKSIYLEAIQTLQEQAAGLRGRPEPEVQSELAKIDSLLKAARNKIQRQPLLNGAAKFVWPAAKANTSLNPDQIARLNDLAASLTAPCRECHTVENAAIWRVQKDQRILQRAEFNHRAHIVQRRCLECHAQIPIIPPQRDEAAATVKNVQDRAAIQNIPDIENCRACHNREETSNRCVTCHYFHPNKTNRSNLLLYLD